MSCEIETVVKTVIIVTFWTIRCMKKIDNLQLCDFHQEPIEQK